MALNDIYRISIECSYQRASNPVVNVFHYRQETANVLGNGTADLNAAWRDEVQDAYLNCLNSSTALSVRRIRNITNPTEGADFSPTPAPFGTLAGTPYAPQVAPLISWRTGLIGRSFRGRTYLPAPTEADIGVAGAIEAGLLASMAAFAEAAREIAAAAGHAGFRLVIYSETLLTATPVNNHVISSQAKTMRRRN